MAYYIGTRKGNDIYIRCPHCGDSEHRQHIAHLSVNVTNGLYYCFRCGASGKLDTISLISLLTQYDQDVSDIEPIEYLATFDITKDQRHTLLASDIVLLKGEKYRRWESKDTKGNITGYYLRHIDYKKSLFDGIKSFGYPAKELVSTSSLRIVEGVYDVVLPEDVCVFGKITAKALKKLLFYPLVLSFDRDCIYETNNLPYTINTVERAIKQGNNILAIEVFENVKDAGEAYERGIRGLFYSPQEFLKEGKKVLNG